MYFFLDIDGTLIPPSEELGHSNGKINPFSIAIINILAELTGARIVLISKRCRHTSQEALIGWLRDSGLTAPFAEDWKIRDGNSEASETEFRGGRIQEYLTNHGLSAEDCLIFDDINAGYRGQLAERFVQPSFTNSLDLNNFERAARTLGVSHADQLQARLRLQQILGHMPGQPGNYPARS